MLVEDMQRFDCLCGCPYADHFGIKRPGSKEPKAGPCKKCPDCYSFRIDRKPAGIMPHGGPMPGVTVKVEAPKAAPEWKPAPRVSTPPPPLPPAPIPQVQPMTPIPQQPAKPTALPDDVLADLGMDTENKRTIYRAVVERPGVTQDEVAAKMGVETRGGFGVNVMSLMRMGAVERHEVVHEGDIVQRLYPSTGLAHSLRRKAASLIQLADTLEAKK